MLSGSTIFRLVCSEDGCTPFRFTDKDTARKKGASRQTFKTGTVQANRLRFLFLEMGEGPLALCLHGFPDHARSFRHQLPANRVTALNSEAEDWQERAMRWFESASREAAEESEQ